MHWEAVDVSFHCQSCSLVAEEPIVWGWERWKKGEATTCEIWTFLCWNLPVISELLNGSKFYYHVLFTGPFNFTSQSLDWCEGGDSEQLFWFLHTSEAAERPFLYECSNQSLLPPSFFLCQQGIIVLLVTHARVLPGMSFPESQWKKLLWRLVLSPLSLSPHGANTGSSLLSHFVWSVLLFYNSAFSRFLSYPVRNSGVHPFAWACLSSHH